MAFDATFKKRRAKDEKIDKMRKLKWHFLIILKSSRKKTKQIYLLSLYKETILYCDFVHAKLQLPANIPRYREFLFFSNFKIDYINAI